MQQSIAKYDQQTQTFVDSKPEKLLTSIGHQSEPTITFGNEME